MEKQWSDLPFTVLWRTALVRAPRLVPRVFLRVLSPEGPYPVIIKVPSRHGYRISIWAFLPPRSAFEDVQHVPVHLDFHGGSFVMGAPFEQAPFCAKLARERRCIVLCIDYAMGPFVKFPNALHDAEDILLAVQDEEKVTEAGKILYTAIDKCYLPHFRDHRKESRAQAKDCVVIDSTQLSFSGFSSGGNLALNLVLSTRTDEEGAATDEWACLIPHEGKHPIRVILYYPQFDMRLLSFERPAPSRIAKPGWFAKTLEKHLVPTYAPEHIRPHPRASPGLAEMAKLHERAQLFVVTAELDTMAEQNQAWLEKMTSEDQIEKVTLFRAPQVVHGFATFPERWLTAHSLKQKHKSYAWMMEWWGKKPVVNQDSTKKSSFIPGK